MNITIGWWNTSLSPTGKPRSKGHEENVELGLIAILNMLAEKDLDFLALGEVTREDLIKLELTLKNTKFELKVCDSKAGKSTFSQAYIFNTDKIDITASTQLTWGIADRTYRAGDSLKITVWDGSEFILVVSHWPSNVQSGSEKIRSQLGYKLRDYFKYVTESGIDNPYMIFMGDYNSEPFEGPLADCLIATRDKNRVLKKADLFYNPYWTKLGMSNCNSFCGSCYYESGLSSNWNLFDQIIFSSAFVSGDIWKIDDSGTTIGIEHALNLVINKNLVFDHLPVFARLERTHE